MSTPDIVASMVDPQFPPHSAAAGLVTNAPPGSIDQSIDILLNYVKSTFGQEQIVQAKEDFFWLMGKVFHDDEFYETRMNYFIDSFLLERPLTQQGKTKNSPLYLFQEAHPSSQDIISYRHSLFQIKRIQPQRLTIGDLLERQPIEVVARPEESFKHLERKQILQGFIYRSATANYLSKGVIYHPSRANAVILKSIRLSQRDVNVSFAKILGLLAKQHLRYLRHSHVDPRRVYADHQTNT